VVAVIKRLYLANGTILTPLSKASEDVAVDTSIATLLNEGLGIGDHCYLTLMNNNYIEVIKVRKDYSGLRVDRGQDGTCRQDFPAQTKLLYKLTSAEIQDASTAANYEIYASGYGFATVIGGNGVWVIGAPAIYADAVGGIETRTEGNELVIFDRTGMFGCCDGGVTGAPTIPGPYFYLTSMLYPQEAIEVMTPQPKDKHGNTISPINFDIPWWLLTQPSLVERYLQTGITVFDWQKYGSEGSFTAPIEKYIRTDIGVGAYGEWVRYGGQQEFIAPIEHYIFRDCYPLQMLLFGGEVTYDKALDLYLLPTITVLDWTLADG
jgi:hypothetical protein